MGMEGGNINRRKFLQAVTGAAVLAAASPFVPVNEAEAASKKKHQGAKAKNIERVPGKPYPLAEKLAFSERNYKNAERKPWNNFRAMVPKGLKIVPQLLRFDVPPNISGLIKGANIIGSENARRAGRLERALRFKNISDAVEFRYNLPPGIILAMVMQESHGADMNPNALNDGGIGLAHMQPLLAQEFGLETYKGNAKLKDRKHGKALREEIKGKRHDVFKLAAEDDDRFNRVLNLDAVGRMLATHMGSAPPASPALNFAVLRYAGRHNYSRYWNQLSKRMSELHNPAYLAEVAAGFNARNKSLKINGMQATGNLPPFALYLDAFWKQNEKGFDLDRYKKLPAYKPARSDEALRTWRKDLIKT